MYGVDLQEITVDLDSFTTFNEFFTREVSPRPIDLEKTDEIVLKSQ